MTETNVVTLVLLTTWTVVMFWVSVVSMLVATYSNNRIKKQAMEVHCVDKISLLPPDEREEIMELCSDRFWAPVKFWIIGVAAIVAVGIAFHFIR